MKAKDNTPEFVVVERSRYADSCYARVIEATDAEDAAGQYYAKTYVRVGDALEVFALPKATKKFEVTQGDADRKDEIERLAELAASAAEAEAEAEAVTS